MSDKITSLPATSTFTVEQALSRALQVHERRGLTEVIIIGYDSDGDLFIHSSRMARRDAFWLASEAMEWARKGDKK